MLLGNAQWTLPTCTLRVRASHSNSLKHYPCPISFTPHKHPWEQMSAIISTVILGKKTEAQTDLIIWFEVTYLMTYLNMGSLSPKSKSLALLLYPLRISQNTHISFWNFWGLFFYLLMPPFLNILSCLQCILLRPLSSGTVNTSGTSSNHSSSPADNIWHTI